MPTPAAAEAMPPTSAVAKPAAADAAVTSLAASADTAVAGPAAAEQGAAVHASVPSDGMAAASAKPAATPVPEAVPVAAPVTPEAPATFKPVTAVPPPPPQTAAAAASVLAASTDLAPAAQVRPVWMSLHLLCRFGSHCRRLAHAGNAPDQNSVATHVQLTVLTQLPRVPLADQQGEWQWSYHQPQPGLWLQPPGTPGSPRPRCADMLTLAARWHVLRVRCERRLLSDGAHRITRCFAAGPAAGCGGRAHGGGIQAQAGACNGATQGAPLS
jgi:hypothetical protein